MFEQVKRIVIKVGSQLLAGEDGLNRNFIDKIANELSTIKQQGKEVVLVSSGAVLGGIKLLNFKRKPKSIQEKQALSAIGQPYLMAEYTKAFAKHGEKIAQILLTAEDLRSKDRFIHAKDTFNSLFKLKVIPIVNENDTVSVEEIKIGDNDNLAAHVSVVVEADLLIMLTTTNGIFDKDPNLFSDAKKIDVVDDINQLQLTCNFNGKSSFGTGGMWTKIEAAFKAARKGIPVIIANGKEENITTKILSGEKKGTLILPKKKLKAKSYRILYLEEPKGKLFIDKGAEKAVLEKGKSLLPKGIKKVEGVFHKGDVVSVFSEDGKLLFKGIVKCNSTELSEFNKECIHRDDMVFIDRIED
ncbi:glutamate 5-kinase [Desulfurobacterium atlanticum]|uniref:Glutamate 5-kinase n=1 Tax=Desulfurobacterium atlanticum TaxID=240169 RepID=A0A238ZFJ3_9BACT|nr:glutamate 5-kinase [Desulfurobacterium atlanticum]SNR82285.1 glutamate 5-kinase [Desulfurobacterium atlanticum]